MSTPTDRATVRGDTPAKERAERPARRRVGAARKPRTLPAPVGQDGPEVVVLSDRDGASRRAAQRLAAILSEAVAAPGRAGWGTTGGSTPPAIYNQQAQAPRRD
jgi:hypothetical protein